MQPNPYQGPTAGGPPAGEPGRTPEGWMACPKCASTSATMPTFTWWGGMIGAKMLTHIKCNQCGESYNGKTGGSNTGGIVIYSIVVGGIAIALMIAIQSM